MIVLSGMGAWEAMHERDVTNANLAGDNPISAKARGVIDGCRLKAWLWRLG